MATGLIQALDESWSAWLNALDRVPREQLNEPGVCGQWSVKDLVGHIALWDAEVLTDVTRWQLGLAFLTNEWQQMNDDDHLAKADRPFDLLRVEMYATHAAVRNALSGIPDEIDEEFRYRLSVDTWEHYPEHTADILAWLARTGN